MSSLALELRREVTQHPLAALLLALGTGLALAGVMGADYGLILGIVVALALGNPFAGRLAPWTKKLLQLAVVGMGAGVQMEVIIRSGLRGAALTALTLLSAIAIGWVLHRVLRVEPRVAALLTVGTAICGGSAIAAAAPVLKARAEEVSSALATVFALNAIALIAFPHIGHALGMGMEQFGAWAALAIHDTSSVVGAAQTYGPDAEAVAVPMKLTRALWIVPLTMVVALLMPREPGTEKAKPKAKIPRFIIGFVVVAALGTWVPSVFPDTALAFEGIARGARRLLVVAIFFTGAGMSRGLLRKIGARPLLMGVGLWIPLALIAYVVATLAT